MVRDHGFEHTCLIRDSLLACCGRGSRVYSTTYYTTRADRSLSAYILERTTVHIEFLPPVNTHQGNAERKYIYGTVPLSGNRSDGFIGLAGRKYHGLWCGARDALAELYLFVSCLLRFPNKFGFELCMINSGWISYNSLWLQMTCAFLM